MNKAVMSSLLAIFCLIAFSIYILFKMNHMVDFYEKTDAAFQDNIAKKVEVIGSEGEVIDRERIVNFIKVAALKTVEQEVIKKQYHLQILLLVMFFLSTFSLIVMDFLRRNKKH